MTIPNSGNPIPNPGSDPFPEGTIYIEIRGIYDGTSVYKLPSGEYVNRWPVDDFRHARTQEWIDRAMAMEANE